MLKEAVAQAAGTIKSALARVGGDVPQPTQAPKLSVKQQLDIFASLTDDDFNQLRNTHGEEQVSQYVRAMQKLSRNT